MIPLVALLVAFSSAGIYRVYEKAGLEGASDRAVSHGWYPCTVAAVTTALGLGSLVTSYVVPISKFGIYSAFGVLAGLLLLFFQDDFQLLISQKTQVNEDLSYATGSHGGIEGFRGKVDPAVSHGR